MENGVITWENIEMEHELTPHPIWKEIWINEECYRRTWCIWCGKTGFCLGFDPECDPKTAEPVGP